MDALIQKIYFLDNKINNFRGDVTDVSAETAPLACRHWMRHVLQPLNERAADIIVTRIDLLQDDRISELLLQLVAHVSANRGVLQNWSEGDLDAWSAITYPDKVPAYISAEFARVKQLQAELLGVKLPSKL